MRVLGVAGSLREDSHNRRLLRAAAGLLPPGVELVLFDGLKAVEPYDQDDEPNPGVGARRWRAAVQEADAVLFATPEYNSSIPGVLKNAVDWASRPTPREGALAGKPAAVIGASTGMFGAVWAQAELRKTVAAAGARVIDRELAVGSADEAFTAEGGLADSELELELRSILAELEGAVCERERRAA